MALDAPYTAASQAADKAEIQELIALYCDGVTRRDWAQVASVFAADAMWEIVGSDFRFQGDKIAAGIQSLVTPSRFLIQMVSSTIIEVRGDTATARTTIHEATEFPAGAFKPFKTRISSYGIYEDQIKKVGGHWKFAARRFNMIDNHVINAEGGEESIIKGTHG